MSEKNFKVSDGQDVRSRLPGKRVGQLVQMRDDGFFTAMLEEIKSGLHLGLHTAFKEMTFP